MSNLEPCWGGVARPGAPSSPHAFPCDEPYTRRAISADLTQSKRMKDPESGPRIRSIFSRARRRRLLRPGRDHYENTSHYQNSGGQLTWSQPLTSKKMRHEDCYSWIK